MKRINRVLAVVIALVLMVEMPDQSFLSNAQSKTEQTAAPELEAEQKLELPSTEEAASETGDTQATVPAQTPGDTQSTEAEQTTEQDTQTEADTQTSEQDTQSDNDKQQTEELEQADTETTETGITDSVMMMADGGYAFATAAALQTACSAAGSATNPITTGNITTTTDGKISAIEVQSAAMLILLSNTDPSLYQNATLTRNMTGLDFDLTGTVTIADQSYSYLGLGSTSAPFQGTFAGAQSWAFQLNRPLLEAVSSKAKITGTAALTLTWAKSDSVADSVLFAKQFVFDESNASTAWTLKVGASPLTTENSYSVGGLIDTVTKGTDVTAGTLDLNVDYSAVYTDSSKNVIAYNTTSDAGLLCNSLEAGTVIVSGLTLPTGMPISITTTGASKSAGGLIGKMADHTGLELHTAPSTSAAFGVSATGSAGNAGGLVGSMGTDTSLKLNSTLTIGTNYNISATGSAGNAGGLVGSAANVKTMEVAENSRVTIGACAISGAGSAGGVIGSYTLSEGSKWNSFTETNRITVDGAVLKSLAANACAGGLFGILTLGTGSSHETFTMKGASADKPLTFQSTIASGTSGVIYGGVIGKVEAASDANLTTLNSLVIQNVTATETDFPQVTTFGGVIGMVWDSGNGVYVKLDDVNASIGSGSASSSYGGMVGGLWRYGVLDVGNVKVDTKGNTITGSMAGGLAGDVRQGAAVSMRGTIDLSAAPTSPGDTTGQLIGNQNNSLIYATADWMYVRSSTACYVDDIGNYGQVIRLGNGLSKDLIQLDATTHKVTLNSAASTPYNQNLTISSADDFARLAITIQTEKWFGGYSAATVSALTSFNTNITLGADISLVGTGLMGFMRDNNSDSTANDGIDFTTYSGNLVGGTHTITLATGESYGYRETVDQAVTAGEAGSGQIYRHVAIGLFARVNGSTVSNLSLKGNIWYGGQTNQSVGTIASNVGNITITSVDILNTMTITRVEWSTSPQNTNAGGMIGQINYGSNNTISITNSKSEGTITETVKSNSGKSILESSLIGWASSSSTIIFDTITIGGKLSAYNESNACLGGLIAISENQLKNIYISKVDIRGLKISTNRSDITSESTSNTSTAGGVLGYQWYNTNVYFSKTSATQSADYGVKVSGATNIDVRTSNDKEGSTSFGGLVNRATGYWQVNANGCIMENLSITAGSGALGLLVCRGEPVSSYGVTSALYLELTDSTSYQISSETAVDISSSTSIFDELVAYTANQASDIPGNGRSIVSIATQDHKLLNASRVTGYHNRTAYGKKKMTNACSRYYYNLDQYKTIDSNDKTLNTPEKVLMASVRQYMNGYLGMYLGAKNTGYTITGTINLSGYSYYPVSVGIGTDIAAIMNATITFDNTGLEATFTEEADTGYKTTYGTSGTHAQHYLMHHGLFINGTIPQKTTALTVANLSMTGSVASISGSNGAGALFCGQIYGGINNDVPYYLELTMTDVNLSGLTMNNAGTAEAANYAPLLINAIGSYTTFSLTNLRCTTTETGASNLIGNVGSGTESKAISLVFSDIKLDGSSNQFTRSTLLNSFRYGVDSGCMGVYNFNHDEDWNVAEHIRNVTYGQEIYSSIEYADQEKMYYDTQTAGNEVYVSTTTSNQTNKDATLEFKDYKRYVYEKYAAADNNVYHELRVNLYTPDLTEGCGTYQDPYIIKTAGQLETVARYIKTANATANAGWKININTVTPTSAGQEDVHVTYEYKGTRWVSDGQTDYDKDTMCVYLRNAYYMIDGDITLGENFVGFGGTEVYGTYAFRGVIIGKNDNGNSPTITITSNAKDAYGLINYSYGSVVKNLNIAYTGATDRTLTAGSTTIGVQFGGVIGQIYGGDNLIDNVKVTYADEYNVKLTGTYHYMIPVGGYVGLMEAGGLIFRNMTQGNTAYAGLTYSNVNENGLTNTITATSENYFYVNPYIGRVLNGYAFYETSGSTKNVLDNTDKNYQIATLDTKKDKLEVASTSKPDGGDDATYYAVKIANAQQLLILSALTNSGAAAGGETYAYYSADTIHGKVRNAEYSNIGATYSTDNATAAVDEKASCGITTANNITTVNVPYLVQKYTSTTTATAFYLNASKTRISLEFASGAVYDMSTYGNGYRALGGRYRTNASRTANSTYELDRNSLYIYHITGNNAKLLMNETVREYTEDSKSNNNYPAVAVGGLFNAYQAAKASTISDFVIGNTSSNKSTVSLTYYGVDSDGSHTMTSWPAGRPLAGVGGFAGTSAKKDFNRTATFTNVQIQNIKVWGMTVAGGLFGSIGIYDEMCGFSNYSNKNLMTVVLDNCNYAQIDISAGYFAAGFIGITGASGTFWSGGTQQDVSEIENATIDTTGSSITTVWRSTELGGVSPLIGRCLSNMKISNITIKGNGFASNTTDTYVGMIAANVRTNTLTVDNVMITGVTASGNSVGGMVGDVDSGTLAVTNSKIQNNSLTNVTNVGGVVGSAAGGTVKVTGSTVENNSNTTGFTGTHVGGMIGSTSGGVTVQIDSSMIQNNVLTGTATSGGVIGNSGGSAKKTVTECVIQNNTITGSGTHLASAGGAIGYSDSPASFMKCIIYTNIIKVPEGAGKAGGLVGTLTSNKVEGSNLLWKNNEISIKKESNGKAGIWAGSFYSAASTLQLAGVTGVTRNQNESQELEWADIGDTTYEKEGSYKSYIAYADYIGTADPKPTGGYTVDNAAALAITTSPASNPEIKVTPNGQTELTLYGDSVASTMVDSASVEMTQKISADIVSASTVPKAYENVDSDFAGLLSSSATRSSYISTYADNQNVGDPTFPVLVVDAKSTDNIAKYLDIITNGAYSSAVQGGTDCVEVSATQYGYSNGKFTELTDATRPALEVSPQTTSTTEVGYRVTSQYDNMRNRFTLLKVDFKGGDGYTVYLPIIVKRVLEIDFMATMSYGTVFNQSNYAGLTNHILESYGNTVSVLLSYKYNYSRGTYVDYGWQSYMDGGGNLNTSYDKQIVFTNSNNGVIPGGTEFTLVDTQSGDKMYTYTLGADSAAGSLTLDLSAFKASDGASSFTNITFGELFGATAVEDKSGTWIKLENAENATVKTAAGDYYRLATASDAASSKRYAITVSESATNVVQENYYLLITIPKSESDAASYINGKITTNLSGQAAPPCNMVQVRRSQQTMIDNGANTESTYSFLAGYQVQLTDHDTGTENSNIKKWTSADNTLEINLSNAISFNRDQSYNEEDMLYLKYQTTLQQVLGDKGSNIQFPAGVSGTADFYVYTQDAAGTKTYYTWDSATSKWSSGTSEALAFAGYEWQSIGDNMKLFFGTDNSSDGAVSLAQVRQYAKTAGLDKIYVDLKMSIPFSQDAAEMAIPSAVVSGENQSPADYLRMNYRASIATEKQSLDYSSTFGTQLGNVKYYRASESNSTLEYQSIDTSELGINCSEPTTGDVSRIRTNAIYDLSKVNGITSTLSSSTEVQLTFTLLKKKADGTGYDNVSSPGDYLSIYLDGATEALTWSKSTPSTATLTISKTDYAKYQHDGANATFAIPIMLDVKTTVKEYANYRVAVTATLLNGDGVIAGTSAEDYLTYTLARINTDGFWYTKQQ